MPLCGKSLYPFIKFYNHVISFLRTLLLIKFITQLHMCLFLPIIPPKMEVRVQFITA